MAKRDARALARVAIVLVGTAVAFYLALLWIGGAFAFWECAGRVPEEPARILAGEVGSDPGTLVGRLQGARVTQVYVETASGRIYRYSSHADPAWEQVDRLEVKEVNFYDCGRADAEASLPHLRDEISSYAIFGCGEWDGGAAVYAIRRDGTLWRRVSHFAFPAWVAELCCVTSLGFVVASIIGSRVFGRAKEGGSASAGE